MALPSGRAVYCFSSGRKEPLRLEPRAEMIRSDGKTPQAAEERAGRTAEADTLSPNPDQEG